MRAMMETKKERGFSLAIVYGLFLSISSAITANPIMIMTIIATTEGTKYRSAIDGAGVVAGGAVDVAAGA